MERWVDDITISTSSSHRKPCILSYNYKASPEWQRSTQCDSLIMAAADKSSILLLNIVLHTVCQEYYYSAFPCTQQHCFSNDNRFFGGHVYGQSFHGCQLLTREWCPTSKYYTSFGWCSSRRGVGAADEPGQGPPVTLATPSPQGYLFIYFRYL